MTAQHTPHAIPEPAAELQAWRARALNILFWIILIVATPRVAKNIIETVGTPEWWSQTAPFVAIYLLFFALTVFHRLDFRLRAWGLVIIGYVFAVVSMALFGLVGSGRSLLLAMPLLGMMLIGPRPGLAMMGLSLLLYGLFSLFAYLGWLQNWLTMTENPTDLETWTGAIGPVFAGLLIMLVVMQWLFTRAQTRLIEEARRTAAELAQARDQLQAHSNALDRYTRLLEVGSLVSRETAVLRDREELLDRAVHLIAQQLDFDQVAVYLITEGGDIDLVAVAHPRPTHELTALQSIQRVIQTGIHQSNRIPLEEGVHHELTLPLRSAEQVIGALDIHATRPAVFSEQEIAALQGMADLLALALENARLLSEMQTNLRELDALYRHYTLESWQQFLGGQPEPLRYRSGADEIPSHVWEPLFAQARESGKPVTKESTNAKGEQRYLLAMPVKLRQIPIGVLGFHRPADAGPWQADDIAAIETVADRLALAVDNVRLLESAQRRAAREQAIGEVATRIRESLEMETVLRTAAEEMRRTLGLERVIVRLATPEQT